MASEITHPTVATSATHLSIAARKFSLAASREEMIAIAEKHKPHMLETDIERMRELFKKHPYHNQGEIA